jgi:hypothetical protein
MKTRPLTTIEEIATAVGAIAEELSMVNDHLERIAAALEVQAGLPVDKDGE